MFDARRIRRHIKVYQNLHDLTNAQMAVLMHMPESTWKHKKGSPEKFTIEELSRLEDKTKITIFAKENNNVRI